jgi:hypothetical protein
LPVWRGERILLLNRTHLWNAGLTGCQAFSDAAAEEIEGGGIAFQNGGHADRASDRRCIDCPRER